MRRVPVQSIELGIAFARPFSVAAAAFFGRARTSVLVVVVCALAARADCQTTAGLSRLKQGDTIRVWAASAGLQKSKVAVARLVVDTLVIATRSRFFEVVPKERAIPLAALTRVDVLRRRRPSILGATVGLVIGGAAGFYGGAMLGMKAICHPACPRDTGNSEDLDFRPLFGFVIGGGVGTIAGASFGAYFGGRRSPRWETVPINR